MENKENLKDKAKKTIGLFIGWLVGIFFLLIGLVSFSINSTDAVIFLLVALVALPPVSRAVNEKLHIKLSGGIKAVIIVILLVIMGVFGATNTVERAKQISEQQPETKDVIVKQDIPKVEEKKANETITLNLCETDAENADYWKERGVNLFEKPAEGTVKQIAACESLELEILEKKTVDGTEFYRVKGGGETGWQTAQLLGEIKTEQIEAEPVKQGLVSTIESVVNKIGNYQITVFTEDVEIADDTSEPPLEVIVIADTGEISDCFEAKTQLFAVMEGLYTNPALKGKISRVTFSALGQLRASLGAKDTGFDWSISGPTNFWTVLLQYNAIENETGPIDERTWAVNHNNC